MRGVTSSSSDTSRLEEFKWGFWEQICCAVCCPDKTGWIADFFSWFCWCCDQTERVMRDRLPIAFRMELIGRFGSAIKAVPAEHSLFHALAHAALQGRQTVRVVDTNYSGGQEDELAKALIAQSSSSAKPKYMTDSRKDTIQGQSKIVAFCRAHEVHVF